jgi:hypothetical protein
MKINIEYNVFRSLKDLSRGDVCTIENSDTVVLVTKTEEGGRVEVFNFENHRFYELDGNSAVYRIDPRDITMTVSFPKVSTILAC